MLGEADAALKDLRAATAAGWLDYRLLAMDPRFDSIAKTPQFGTIFKDLATRVADLRRQEPADKMASTTK